VGLLGAPRKQYVFNAWNRPDELISNHPMKGGGLWVTPTKSTAKAFKKYVLKNHKIVTRIFLCRIDRVIYRTSCRIKTSGVFFNTEDEILE